MFDAWSRFRKGKNSKLDVLVFENELETNIFLLHEDLISDQYKHGKYLFFQVNDSKKRAIHKALVRDRIVHEFLRFRLENKFEKLFIRDSFSSRKEKGTLKAINKFKYFLSQTRYTLSLDVRKYFDSINQEILLQKISREFLENTLEYKLSKMIINSFGSDGRGIPLGNSVSQIFSNIYLNDFDWFVLEKNYKYIRYNDDIRICFDNIGKIKIKEFLNYLQNNLKLIIPRNKIKISKNFQGVEFLGHVVSANYCIIKKQTKKKILQRLNEENQFSYLGLISKQNNYDFSLQLKSMYNSNINEKF